MMIKGSLLLSTAIVRRRSGIGEHPKKLEPLLISATIEDSNFKFGSWGVRYNNSFSTVTMAPG